MDIGITDKKEPSVPVITDMRVSEFDINNVITDTAGIIKTEVKINLDTKCYRTKPQNHSWVSKDLRCKETQAILPIADIAAASLRGQTLTAGVLTASKAEDWTQQQLFIWDIDNGEDVLPHLTPQEVLDIFTANRIYPVYAYWTFSAKPERLKWRIACLCSEVITDRVECKRIIQSVIDLFPTAIKMEIMENGKTRQKKVSQIDLQCTDLNRMFYGTDKGLISEYVGHRTFCKADALKLFKKPETKPKREHKSPSTAYGHLDLERAYSEFDLLGYIQATTGNMGMRRGKDVLFNPCPICGHKDDFYVDTEKNVYKCHSSSYGQGGNIFNFIKETENLSDTETRNHFKYNILMIDREQENREWREKQSKQQCNGQQQGQSLLPHYELPSTLIWFDKVECKDIDWYWYPYIRRGAINAIVATQGTGKSYLMCMVAAIASRGKRHELPFQDRHSNYHPFTEPEKTLYLNAEDDPEEDTRRRLDLCDADLSKIATVDLQAMAINFYDPSIEIWIKEANPSLVVFDPIQQFFTGIDPHGKALDMNDSASVRPIFTHIKMLAKKYNVAVVFIMHPNKNNMQSALYAAMGSNDMTAAPRSAVYIGRDPEDKERRIIAITKANSVPDRDQVSLAYKWDDEKGGIYFDGESDLQADDIRDTRRKNRTAGDIPPNKTQEAIVWLEDLLTAHNGYMLLKDIEKTRANTEITSYAMYEAKKKCKDFIKDTGKGKGIITYWYIVGYEPPGHKLL
jgi:hypothetical protein